MWTHVNLLYITLVIDWETGYECSGITDHYTFSLFKKNEATEKCSESMSINPNGLQVSKYILQLQQYPESKI